MEQYKNWEQEQLAAAAGPKVDLFKCVKCECSWLEPVSANQYDRNKISGLGQTPASEISFIILRCVRCLELHEPPINRIYNHPSSSAYDSLIDTLENKPQE